VSAVYEAKVWFGVVFPERVPDKALKLFGLDRSSDDTHDYYRMRDELQSDLRGYLECIQWGDACKAEGFGIAMRSTVRKVRNGSVVSWPDKRPALTKLNSMLKRLGITTAPSWHLTMDVR
jgi:hypothetical protein